MFFFIKFFLKNSSEVFLHEVHQIYEVRSVDFPFMNILNKTVPGVLPLWELSRQKVKVVSKRVFVSLCGNKKNNCELAS